MCHMSSSRCSDLPALAPDPQWRAPPAETLSPKPLRKPAEGGSRGALQMYVRRHFFFPPGRVTAYYENTVAKVRAEAQVTLPSRGASHSEPYF